MLYNISMDICAIFVFMVIIVFLYQKKSIHIAAYNSFLILVWTGLITCFMDIYHSFIVSYPEHYSIIYLRIVTYVYLVMQTGMALIFSFYVVFSTGYQYKLKKRFFMILLLGPSFIQQLFFLLNPFFDWIFYFDSNHRYVHNWAYIIIYIVAAWYLIFSFTMLYKERNKLSRMKRLALVLYLIFTLSAIIIQMLYSYYLVVLFAISISCVMLSFTIQNPEDTLDVNTGLLNYQAFVEKEAFRYRHGIKSAKLLVNIRNISFLAQTIGLDYINAILKQNAEKFVNICQSDFEIYYYNAGCFLLVKENVADFELDILSKKIFALYQKPWSHENIDVTLPVNVSILRSRDNIEDLDNLLEVLEDLKYIKNSKSTIQWYKDMKMKDIIRKRNVEKAIQNALDKKKFEVYYQPIYSTKEKKIVSAEALIRLHDEAFGYISPEEFITIAEKNGTIIEVGHFVLESVCQFIHDNNIDKLGLQYIEVNLSVIQCMQHGFSNWVVELLEKYQVSPSFINFEVTETVATNSFDTLKTQMDRLSQLGLKFSLDDYGTGYSNIHSVINLPFHLVKLDKSLIWSADKNLKAQISLESTIVMMKKLNIQLVAEGVETIDHVNKLIDLDVEYLQGYYFSKPLPVSSFLHLLEQNI